MTSGLGVLPGPGPGGGGGSGGGSGGGVGRGVGPGTAFFGARERAGSFAYVIDCSGSMASRGSLDVAKRELLASLDQLPPDARFGVVFYNVRPTVFTDPPGRPGPDAGDRGEQGAGPRPAGAIVPDGGTNHMIALRAALALRPEVIFFLTDADLMTVQRRRADPSPRPARPGSRPSSSAPGPTPACRSPCGRWRRRPAARTATST